MSSVATERAAPAGHQGRRVVEGRRLMQAAGDVPIPAAPPGA